MKIVIRNIILMFICQSALSVFSEEVFIRAKVDKNKVPINENIILTVTVSGSNVGKPNIPKIDGIVIYPSGQSQNITIINGKIASSASYAYIVQPHAMGVFTIPPIQVNENGKTYSSESIKIDVVKASLAIETKSASIPKDENAVKETRSGYEEKNKNEPLFSQANVDKKEVYIGEQIIFNYKFYRKTNLLGQPQFNPPNFTNFWVEDLPPEKLYYEMVNGERYVVSEINTALFPTTTGVCVIEPVQLRCQIPESGVNRDSFQLFDEDPFQFFNSDPFNVFKGKDVLLKTDPINILVKNLPLKDKPSRFSGAVGEYSIKSYIDKTSIDVNQTLILSIEIEGRGNIQALSEPQIDLKDNTLRLYDSGNSVEIKKDKGYVYGKKTFKKLVIPTKTGSIQIPPIKYNYFDPKESKYKNIQTENILIEVKKTKNEGSINQKEDSKNLKEDVVLLAEDIHYIKTNYQKFADYSKYPDLKNLLYSLIIPLFFLITALLKRLKQIINQDHHRIMFKKAYQNALKEIKQMERNDHIFDYGKVENIFIKYLSYKTRQSMKEHQINKIEENLLKAGIDERNSSEIKNFLNELQYFQFAVKQNNKDAKEQIIKKMKNILKIIESKL